jgi:hypothetical protein
VTEQKSVHESLNCKAGFALPATQCSQMIVGKTVLAAEVAAPKVLRRPKPKR